MFCPYCGNKLDDDARFCGNCGTPVQFDRESTGEVEDENAQDNREYYGDDDATSAASDYYEDSYKEIDEEPEDMDLKFTGGIVDPDGNRMYDDVGDQGRYASPGKTHTGVIAALLVVCALCLGVIAWEVLSLIQLRSTGAEEPFKAPKLTVAADASGEEDAEAAEVSAEESSEETTEN